MVNAQTEDREMQQLLRRNNEKYYIRDELIRTKNENGEDNIIVPGKIAWDLINLINRYFVHFGTDKVKEFANRYFKIKFRKTNT